MLCVASSFKALLVSHWELVPGSLICVLKLSSHRASSADKDQPGGATGAEMILKGFVIRRLPCSGHLTHCSLELSVDSQVETIVVVVAPIA